MINRTDPMILGFKAYNINNYVYRKIYPNIP